MQTRRYHLLSHVGMVAPQSLRCTQENTIAFFDDVVALEAL